MTSAEQVTEFSLGETGNRPLIEDFLDALNKHLKQSEETTPEENDFSSFLSRQERATARIPDGFWSLVAFPTEGSNEGYYIYVGALMPADRLDVKPFHSFGSCKTYSAKSAYAIARECSRFLAAAAWN